MCSNGAGAAWMHESVDRTRSGSQTPPLKPRSSTRRGLFRPKDPFARDVCPACVSMRAAPPSRAIDWPRCRRHRHRRSTALRSAALHRLSQDDRADGGVCHNRVPPQWPAAKDQVGYSPWVAGESADPVSGPPMRSRWTSPCLTEFALRTDSSTMLLRSRA